VEGIEAPFLGSQGAGWVSTSLPLSPRLGRRVGSSWFLYCFFFFFFLIPLICCFPLARLDSFPIFFLFDLFV